MKRVVTLLLIGFLSFSVRAQIIEFDALAIASDSVIDTARLSGSVSLSFDVNKQDELVYYIKTGGNLAYEKKKHFWVLTANNQATLEGDDQVLNTGSSNFRYLWNFRSKLFPEALVQYQWDVTRGLRERYLAGGNLQSTFINKKSHQFSVSLGAFYENEFWGWTAVPDDRRPTENPAPVSVNFVKANLLLKYSYILKNKSTFSMRVFVQARPDSYIKYPRIAPNATINFRLVKNLFISTSFSGIYDFRPIVPIDKFYYQWENALIYSF